jgi:hypothetical protein
MTSLLEDELELVELDFAAFFAELVEFDVAALFAVDVAMDEFVIS